MSLLRARLISSGLLLLAALFASAALAATSNYSFSTATDDSLTDMTGSTQLLAGNVDDTASAVTSIGFDFFFQGVRYAQFSVNDNGAMRLGPAAVQSGAPYQPLAQAVPVIITAWGADQRVHTTGRVHFKVVGSAPNRVLVVEWLNMQSNWNAGGTADLTYQVRLYETSGAIEFVYGSMTLSALGAAAGDSNDPQFGFSSGNTAGNVGSVTAAQSGDPAPTFDGSSAIPVNNLYVAGPITVLTSTNDGERRVFAFDPPAPDAAPSGLNFTGTTQTSTTLNWTDNATNELAYAIYRSTDGVNFSFAGSSPANTESFMDASLFPGVTYFYRVHAVTEGALSAPTSATVSADPPGNIQSTAAGGNWSDPATWVGGDVPGSLDLVTIADGATVTINTTATVLGLTVGTGGAPAALVFEAATARTLSVTADVEIAANGRLASAASGTVTTHVLSVTGNVVNDGELDLSTNANTAGARLTFAAGPDNVSLTGAGGLTNIRDMTVAKGARSIQVDLSPDNFTVRGVATDVAGFLTLTSGTLRIAGTFPLVNRTFTANYTISAAAGIWLDNPNYTVAGIGGSPTLAGALRVSQGTYNIGTGAGNSMGFSTGSQVLIEGGAVNATGRFGVGAATNAISYTQTGGTVTVATNQNISTTLASFDLGTSTLSSVNISGGSIVVQTANTSGTPRDYRNQAGAGTPGVFGATLQLGNASSGAAKVFNIAGVVPNLHLTNTSADHSANFTGPVTYNNITRDILIDAGTSLNLGNFVFLFNGTTLTNNGTMTHNGASSNFVWFTAGAPVAYTGSGVVTAPMTAFAVQADGGLTIDAASPSIVANAVRLFVGGVTNSNKLTVGNGGATTAVVQIGNTTTPTAAGAFDQPLAFNPGTGGISISYLRTTAPRVTGGELPDPSRTVTTVTIDENNPANTLTLAGGDLSVTGTLNLTNGRVITGSNSLIAGAAAVNRTAGYVDGNLQRTLAAAGTSSFPVGTANGFSPVGLNVTDGTFPADVTVRAVQSVAPAFEFPELAISRYWAIEASDIEADVTFNYLDLDVPVDVSEADLEVFRGLLGVYTSQGGTIDTGNNTATVAGVTTFSDWTLAVSGQGLLTIDPTELAFGNHVVGSTSDALSVTLGNDGTLSLDVTALTEPEAPFELVGGTCGELPISIPAGGSCTVDFAFSPTATVFSEQTLTVTANAPGSGTIELSGTGVQGLLLISPNSVDFGDVLVGSTSGPAMVTLSNVGTASLDVTALDDAVAPFARSGGSCASDVPITIAAGSNCTLEFEFSPAGTGSANQSLSVTANAPGSGSIDLEGTGVQGQLTIAPASIDFGDELVGSTTDAESITLGNSGDGSLDVTALDAASGAFLRTGGTCSDTLPITIAAGENCTIEYSFSPTEAGPAQQTLAVTANAPGSGSFELSGNGLQGVLSIDPVSFDFGFQAVGSSSELGSITLSNTGTAALQVNSLTVASLPFLRTTDGSCGNSLPIVIEIDESCTLTYRFAPTAVEESQQSFNVGSNATGDSSFELTGAGVPAEDEIFFDGFEAID